jgi:Mg2+ and Co2+ transporter CorA
MGLEMTREQMLWGALGLVVSFVLANVIGPIVRPRKYVSEDVCQKCQEIRDRERDSMAREIGEIKAEIVRIRDSLHELKDSLPEMLLTAMKTIKEIRP